MMNAVRVAAAVALLLLTAVVVAWFSPPIGLEPIPVPVEEMLR